MFRSLVFWKKILALCCAILVEELVFSQSKMIMLYDASIGGFVSEKSGLNFDFCASLGRQEKDIFIGGGIGFERSLIENPDYEYGYVSVSYDEMGNFNSVKRFKGNSIPFFVDLRYLPDRDGISPFLGVRTGVSFGFITGIFSDFSAGLKIKLSKNGMFLIPAFFYRIAYEPENLVTDDSRYMEGWFGIVGTKLSIEF